MTSSLVRRKDWRQRLDDYLDSLDGKPFVWGELDCALFAAGAVAAMTDVDFAAPYRGRYSDFETGIALIRSTGFADYGALVAATLPEISLGEANHGDIAAVELDGHASLAIVNKTTIICMTLRGKGPLPLTKASRAFRVG